MLTDDGYQISVGDILKSEDGYSVVVCQDKNGHLYGSLLCSLEHSCRNVPYHLNNGIGYYYVGHIEREQAIDLK